MQEAGLAPLNYYADLVKNSGQIWAYLIILVGMTIEGPFFTIATVVLAHNGFLYLPYVLVASLIAEVISDYLWFLLGRGAGRPILRFLGKHFKSLRISEEREKKLENVFEKHAGKLLIGIKFSYGFSHVGLIIAGLSGLKTKKFFAWIAIVSIPWIAVLVILGLAIGETVQALKIVNAYEFIVTTLILVIIAIAILHQILKRTKLLQRMGFNGTVKEDKK